MGFDGYGPKSTLGAFLFTWPDGDWTQRPFKLPKVGAAVWLWGCGQAGSSEDDSRGSSSRPTGLHRLVAQLMCLLPLLTVLVLVLCCAAMCAGVQRPECCVRWVGQRHPVWAR